MPTTPQAIMDNPRDNMPPCQERSAAGQPRATEGQPWPFTAAGLNPDLDLRDRAQLTEARAAYNRDLPTDRPVVGEWIRYPDGTLHRVGHVWWWGAGDPLNTVQPTPGGRFHLNASGSASYSGGYARNLKPGTLTVTDERLAASFWIWHHGMPRAHNGVDVLVSVRVWECIEQPTT